MACLVLLDKFRLCQPVYSSTCTGRTIPVHTFDPCHKSLDGDFGFQIMPSIVWELSGKIRRNATGKPPCSEAQSFLTNHDRNHGPASGHDLFPGCWQSEQGRIHLLSRKRVGHERHAERFLSRLKILSDRPQQDPGKCVCASGDPSQCCGFCMGIT